MAVSAAPTNADAGFTFAALGGLPVRGLGGRHTCGSGAGMGLLAGKAERLTLREFGDRLSDAASSGFHGSEADELRNVTRDPSITPFDDDEFEDEEPSSSGTIRI